MKDRWHMLSDEERLFCDVLERIVEEQIAPKAAQVDETSDFVHAQLDVLAKDRKSTRLNSSHVKRSRMPSSA